MLLIILDIHFSYTECVQMLGTAFRYLEKCPPIITPLQRSYICNITNEQTVFCPVGKQNCQFARGKSLDCWCNVNGNCLCGQENDFNFDRKWFGQLVSNWNLLFQFFSRYIYVCFKEQKCWNTTITDVNENSISQPQMNLMLVFNIN